MSGDLSNDQFTWICPDLRGYGASRHLEVEFTLHEACKDLTALADHLGIGSFSVAGHSMTGMVALRLALDLPTGEQGNPHRAGHRRRTEARRRGTRFL